MVGFSMDAGTLRLTIASLEAFGQNARKVATAALAKAAEELHAAAVENVSLDDHSLSALEAIDHPYARRHGRINVGALGHSPAWQVHTRPANPGRRNQTGDLRRALKVALLPSARPPGEAWVVYFDVDQAPHAVWVVQGTPRMLPRDVLWWTATDPAVQKEMMRAVVRVLGKDLRTKAVVRFGRSGGSPASPATSPAQTPGNLAI